MIRYADIKDVNSYLMDLYIEGYNMHYEARKDIFSLKTKDELKNELIKLIEDPLEFIILLEEGNQLIGYAAFQYKFKETKSLWIDEIIIDAKMRGQGYGKKLLEGINKIAIENNCRRIELNCWCFNDDALKFYESIGFNAQRVVLEKGL